MHTKLAVLICRVCAPQSKEFDYIIHTAYTANANYRNAHCTCNRHYAAQGNWPDGGPEALLQYWPAWAPRFWQHSRPFPKRVDAAYAVPRRQLPTLLGNFTNIGYIGR